MTDITGYTECYDENGIKIPCDGIDCGHTTIGTKTIYPYPRYGTHWTVTTSESGEFISRSHWFCFYPDGSLSIGKPDEKEPVITLYSCDVDLLRQHFSLEKTGAQPTSE